AAATAAHIAIFFMFSRFFPASRHFAPAFSGLLPIRYRGLAPPILRQRNLRGEFRARGLLQSRIRSAAYRNEDIDGLSRPLAGREPADVCRAYSRRTGRIAAGSAFDAIPEGQRRLRSGRGSGSLLPAAARPSSR